MDRRSGDAGFTVLYALALASEPSLAADGALVAETQTRLGVTLPAGLVTLWREKNGGEVSCRFVDDLEVIRCPVPLE